MHTAIKETLGKPKAFLFDLNGTMVDDMTYHVKAWHTILRDLGSNISMERMKEECYGKNSELLERIFPGRFSPVEKDNMGLKKEEAYQQEFRPKLTLINGLSHFLDKAYNAGIYIAIGSAAIRFNIDFVLDETGIRHYFNAIVSADDVVNSKPHPETFLRGAQQLGILPQQCLVFEDTPKGVEAARNAEMNAIVITTTHQPEDFASYSNILHFANDYTELAFLMT